MMSLLVNVDVPDVRAGVEFYTQAFGLTVGRRLGPTIVELLGTTAPIYLIEKPAAASPAPGVSGRSYARHWTPVHLDLAVGDLDAAVRQANAAGATHERAVETHPWGRIAYLADPFGNGVCLIQFSALGYDAIAEPD
jgi:predicted enzyme related to lactoylglutathione lyase